MERQRRVPRGDGITQRCHPREGADPGRSDRNPEALGSRLRGNDGYTGNGSTIQFYTSIAVAEPACLRNSNFWIFPVEVLGSSPKTTARGTLKPARCFLQ